MNINNLIFINYRIFIILGIRDLNIENQSFTNIILNRSSVKKYPYNINKSKNYDYR
jgi:hypothetical protein